MRSLPAPADYRAAARGDLAARQRAMEIIARHYRQHTKTKTGIWRDLVVRRRKTEVGSLLGATVAKARTLGLGMPLTERLIAMIEDLELGRRAMRKRPGTSSGTATRSMVNGFRVGPRHWPFAK